MYRLSIQQDESCVTSNWFFASLISQNGIFILKLYYHSIHYDTGKSIPVGQVINPVLKHILASNQCKMHAQFSFSKNRNGLHFVWHLFEDISFPLLSINNDLPTLDQYLVTVHHLHGTFYGGVYILWKFLEHGDTPLFYLPF